MSINWMLGITSQGINISNYHYVHFQHLTILLVYINYTSIKLQFKKVKLPEIIFINDIHSHHLNNLRWRGALEAWNSCAADNLLYNFWLPQNLSRPSASLRNWCQHPSQTPQSTDAQFTYITWHSRWLPTTDQKQLFKGPLYFEWTSLLRQLERGLSAKIKITVKFMLLIILYLFWF